MTRFPDRSREAYWRANLRLVAILLLLWFAGSFGAGILWADALNAVRLPGSGFRLGFWFAQQGSIYLFVILIFVYVVLMNRLDRIFGVGEEGGAFPTGRPDLEDPEDVGSREARGLGDASHPTSGGIGGQP
jgi:putative solute:sodium symporter small subunit